MFPKMFHVVLLFSLTAGERLFANNVGCDDFLLEDKEHNPIELHPRTSLAKLIDTFAFGNAYEVEELVLRLYEMGEEVSEFHIVEGDRDFTGAAKQYEFETVLSSGQLDPWRDKITYHKVQIAKGVKGYKLQEAQRQVNRQRRTETMQGKRHQNFAHQTNQ